MEPELRGLRSPPIAAASLLGPPLPHLTCKKGILCFEQSGSEIRTLNYCVLPTIPKVSDCHSQQY